MRAIAWLNIGFSVIAIVIAIAVFTQTSAGLDLREALLEPNFTVARHRARLLSAPDEEEPSAMQYYFRTHPVSDLVLIVVALYSAVMAVPSILNGIHLVRRNSVRARELASICATLQLGSVPIGTVLGIVTLWILSRGSEPGCDSNSLP